MRYPMRKRSTSFKEPPTLANVFSLILHASLTTGVLAWKAVHDLEVAIAFQSAKDEA